MDLIAAQNVAHKGRLVRPLDAFSMDDERAARALIDKGIAWKKGSRAHQEAVKAAEGAAAPKEEGDKVRPADDKGASA